ncbi:SDR family NAD(P)-dependent oxidoreductase [Streptomyces beijiangensis]|uniref:SDR family oxidoreductase n=1 Tax=Streptomyces beijiangensis TaxID=163361 RepID=A0A939JKT8_9ACTN|nr:SDR family oxidoreductase [Streptomyces beijiangensis]MBO0515029.1 SDR family oxidoreductase [Streptomyces beijiangensis]
MDTPSTFLERQFGLTGRTALITGGSSGIGLGIAHALAGAGARVILLARSEDRLRKAAAELKPADVSWISADLASRGELHAAADEMESRFGAPDILVTSAGINPRPPLDDLTEDEWDATMAVNLTAPFLLGQRFGPGMAARGWGRIIHLASQQSIRAFGNSGAYGVSKAGICALTRSQAEAWSRHGVCVNAIGPGFVHTPLTEPAFADPERPKALAARTMTGRNGEPEDFMGAAVFLAGDSARYVTGQTLFADGGFSVT